MIALGAAALSRFAETGIANQHKVGDGYAGVLRKENLEQVLSLDCQFYISNPTDSGIETLFRIPILTIIANSAGLEALDLT